MRMTIVLVLAGLFMALCVWTAHRHAPRIEADLSWRVEAIVAPVPSLVPLVDGRDVTLAGRISSPAESEAMQEAIDCLVRSIGKLHGVGTVRADIRIIVPPASLSAAPAADDDDSGES